MGIESTGQTSWLHKCIVKHSESSQSVSSNGSLNKRNKHRKDHWPDLHIIYFMTASYIHRFTGTGFYHHVWVKVVVHNYCAILLVLYFSSLSEWDLCLRMLQSAPRPALSPVWVRLSIDFCLLILGETTIDCGTQLTYKEMSQVSGKGNSLKREMEWVSYVGYLIF